MKFPEILFENDEFIVLNKPAGLLSVPDRTQSAPSLKDLLIEKYGEIFTVHRLDRETSGVIIFAKTAETHQFLSVNFPGAPGGKNIFRNRLGRLAMHPGSLNCPCWNIRQKTER